jgi:hypothetical protein
MTQLHAEQTIARCAISEVGYGALKISTLGQNSVSANSLEMRQWKSAAWVGLASAPTLLEGMNILLGDFQVARI